MSPGKAALGQKCAPGELPRFSPLSDCQVRQGFQHVMNYFPIKSSSFGTPAHNVRIMLSTKSFHPLKNKN